MQASLFPVLLVPLCQHGTSRSAGPVNTVMENMKRGWHRSQANDERASEERAGRTKRSVPLNKHFISHLSRSLLCGKTPQHMQDKVNGASHSNPRGRPNSCAWSNSHRDVYTLGTLRQTQRLAWDHLLDFLGWVVGRGVRCVRVGGMRYKTERRCRKYNMTGKDSDLEQPSLDGAQ